MREDTNNIRNEKKEGTLLHTTKKLRGYYV